ncbi:MAG: ATP-binding protein [Elainellaceae cyanobacterium]
MIVKPSSRSQTGRALNLVSEQDNGKPPWLQMFSEARTQILLCYIGLMAAFVGVSVPVIYHVLFSQIDQRLKEEVEVEVAEFRKQISKENPETTSKLRGFLSEYIRDEIAEKDLFFIGIVERQLLQTNPEQIPESIKPTFNLMDRLHQLRQPTSGKAIVSDRGVKSVIYAIEPVLIEGETQGLFIVAYITADERREVDAAFRTILSAMLLSLCVASLLAWIISGRVMRPLRLMSSTAHSISESDLSQRIQVKGQGEMAEVAKTFNEMLDRLQNAFMTQQNFLNDASHELRTPITIIQGHLELMGDDPAEQQEVLSLVRDELARMKRLVNDLLLLAKATHPDFLRLEYVDLDTLTEELYEKAKVLVQCDCQLEHKGIGSIRLDRQRVTQAVINLVDNANQHTPAQGCITLGSAMTDREIRFWVQDTGKGIAPSDQERIFERFARANTGPRCSDGAGLGLAIVQAIAMASGGRVELKSAVGKGSTFTLILPVVS